MSKGEWIFTAILLLLLAGLGLPYLQKSRENSRRSTCEAGMIHLSQAFMRQSELTGHLPGYAENKVDKTEINTATPVSWVNALLPYLGVKATPEEIKNQEFDATHTGKFQELTEKTADFCQQFRLSPLTCPSYRPTDANQFRMQFVVNAGLPDAPATPDFPADWPANGVFQNRAEKTGEKIALPVTFESIEAADGRTSTLLLTENVDAGHWTDTSEFQVGIIWKAIVEDEELKRHTSLYEINENRGNGEGSLAFARPSSYHAMGVNAAFADGRTQFINEKIEYEIWVRFLTVNDTQLTQPGTDKVLSAPIRIVR
jgi:Protein of unknown function (DUF1559)